MSQSALHLLEHTFGYHSFRPYQEEIVTAVVEKQDALVIMPTGGGKSLCYQLPALLMDGVAVVISPLIALMQDQVTALRQLGVCASFLNSTLNSAQVREIEEELYSGRLDLLYIAPERLNQDATLAMLEQINVALFAIDEAHCVSQWGHDFRSDYLQLSLLHQRFPKVPRIALTATADERTRDEIILRLNLENAHHFIGGFNRPNIQYRVTQKSDSKYQLLQFLREEHPKDAGIVYCLSRKKVEQVATWLQKQGFDALPYHAGLDSGERENNQGRFIKEEGVIIVATIAFGMGIDKPNVRFVAHLDLPKSIESYYQETGRAGRDGLPATAWMAYGIEDLIKLRKMMESSNGSEAFKQIERHRLDSMLGYSEITSCRRQALLNYFGDDFDDNCGNCDNCLSPVDTWDATVAAQKALSCVYRTRQLFGVTHLLDVLLGKENAKVKKFDHQELSVFGIGKDLSEQQWRSVFRQLVARSYIKVDVSGYGSLCLTEKSRPLLKGEETLFLRKDREAPLSKKAKSSSAMVKDADKELWEALKELRMTLALEQGVPPYVIFHDATLMELVRYQPLTREDFSTINGVGDAKLDRYGDAFIAVLKETREKSKKLSDTKEDKITTAEKSLNLFKQGLSVEQIAESRGLKAATIYQHLCDYISKGELALKQVIDLDDDEIDNIQDALIAEIDGNNRIPLSAVHAHFEGTYDYTILACVRAMVYASLMEAEAL